LVVEELAADGAADHRAGEAQFTDGPV